MSKAMLHHWFMKTLKSLDHCWLANQAKTNPQDNAFFASLISLLQTSKISNWEFDKYSMRPYASHKPGFFISHHRQGLSLRVFLTKETFPFINFLREFIGWTKLKWKDLNENKRMPLIGKVKNLFLWFSFDLFCAPDTR